MKGKRVRIGCAAASLLMGISGTYAYYRSSVETINKIAVGDVNIGIWEYEEDGDGEKKYEGPENGIVLPSQVISKIPRITNYAEPCYVRVKPVFDEEETQDYRLGEEDLGGIEDVWLKAGEYYYYPKVLGKQESVDFFRTITIPSAWTSEAEGQVLSVEIQAEAVQAANVMPDFTAEAPWGEELEIEQCVHEADNTVSEVSQQSFLTVSYEGAARNLILAPDNFFRNFPVLMPGDEWALRKSGVKWIFSVEGEDLPQEEGPSIWHSAPKTGLRDPSAAVPIGIAVTGAFLFLTAGRSERRKE